MGLGLRVALGPHGGVDVAAMRLPACYQVSDGVAAWYMGPRWPNVFLGGESGHWLARADVGRPTRPARPIERSCLAVLPLGQELRPWRLTERMGEASAFTVREAVALVGDGQAAIQTNYLTMLGADRPDVVLYARSATTPFWDSALTWCVMGVRVDMVTWRP